MEIRKDIEKVKPPRKSRSGSPYLDRVRESIVRTYTNEYISKKVGELCEAEDVRLTKAGAEVRTPNWRAREGGLKMILAIQGVGELESGVRAEPAKIVINVVGTAPEAVEVKEIKETQE